LDGLSCCHYGGHLAAALVLVLVVAWGLSNDDDGAAKAVLCVVLDVSVEALRMRRYCFYRVRAVSVRVSLRVVLTTGELGLCCHWLLFTVVILSVLFVWVLCVAVGVGV
jgi:hypothetical protein